MLRGTNTSISPVIPVEKTTYNHDFHLSSIPHLLVWQFSTRYQKFYEFKEANVKRLDFMTRLTVDGICSSLISEKGREYLLKRILKSILVVCSCLQNFMWVHEILLWVKSRVANLNQFTTTIHDSLMAHNRKIDIFDNFLLIIYRKS